MKKILNFFTLPKIQSVGIFGNVKHYGTVLCFGSIGYFLSALLFGNGWKYIQSNEPYYLETVLLLLCGFLFAHIMQCIVRSLGDSCFYCWNKDKYWFTIFFIVAFLTITQLFGF